MCHRHSFCLTRGGKVIDGCGLTDSHTAILNLHELKPEQHDACNLYEWQPPRGWPDANWADGLTVDKAQFEPRQRATDAMLRHVTTLYPDMAAWNGLDSIRWDKLPLPNVERVHGVYDLCLRSKPLAWVDDNIVLEHVNCHLGRLGCSVRAETVVNVASLRYGPQASLQDSLWASLRYSLWDSLRASLRYSPQASLQYILWASLWDSLQDSLRDSLLDSLWDSLWDSLRDSLWDSLQAAMVLGDGKNPWLPLAELATHGAYLYGVADDGTAYILRGKAA